MVRARKGIAAQMGGAASGVQGTMGRRDNGLSLARLPSGAGAWKPMMHILYLGLAGGGRSDSAISDACTVGMKSPRAAASFDATAERRSSEARCAGVLQAIRVKLAGVSI